MDKIWGLAIEESAFINTIRYSIYDLIANNTLTSEISIGTFLFIWFYGQKKLFNKFKA